jgi:DNA replication protein DnaC
MNNDDTEERNPDSDHAMHGLPLPEQLSRLQLPHIRSHYHELAQQAAEHGWGHIDYLERLVRAEIARREDKSLERRIRQARFPLVKTLDQFQWSWPKLNRLQVQALFRLEVIRKKGNAVFLGPVGLGKTHLAIALGHTACMHGHSVLFTTAVDIIHTLSAAIAVGAGALKRTMQRYLKPALLIVDEVGYLPIDKQGADLLFQIISERYERGSVVVTTNRPFKNWGEIFNNDSTLASALLDRLLHHAEVIVVQGKSYRAKEKVDA